MKKIIMTLGLLALSMGSFAVDVDTESKSFKAWKDNLRRMESHIDALGMRIQKEKIRMSQSRIKEPTSSLLSLQEKQGNLQKELAKHMVKKPAQ